MKPRRAHLRIQLKLDWPVDSCFRRRLRSRYRLEHQHLSLQGLHHRHCFQYHPHWAQLPRLFPHLTPLQSYTVARTDTNSYEYPSSAPQLRYLGIEALVEFSKRVFKNLLLHFAAI